MKASLPVTDVIVWFGKGNTIDLGIFFRQPNNAEGNENCLAIIVKVGVLKKDLNNK